MENSKANEAAAEPPLDCGVRLLPCPFCGKPADMDDPDTLYPTGTGWRDDDAVGLRSYHRMTEVPYGQWCWGMHCPTPAGGCGAEVTGDSRDEAIAKWNRRAN